MVQSISTYKITEMSFEDIDHVLSISIEAQIENWTFEGYQSELNNPDSIHLVVKDKQSVIGFLIVRLIMRQGNSPFDKQENEAEIYNIAIKNNYQRRGLGKQLIEEIIQRSNLSKLFLEARVSNSKAISFYQKIGFTVTGRRKNFYQNPPEDALLMDLNTGWNKQTIIKTLD